jgi:hypothetical protein
VLVTTTTEEMTSVEAGASIASGNFGTNAGTSLDGASLDGTLLGKGASLVTLDEEETSLAAGTWLDTEVVGEAAALDVGADDEAGVELGFGEGLLDGFGALLFFAGRVPFSIIKSAWVTSKADSCWPTPEVPSQLPVYHLLPHVVPSVPPEQDLLAPTAEAFSNGTILSLVKGATIAVLAMKRERYALNDC